MGVSTKTASTATTSGLASSSGWAATGGSTLAEVLANNNDDTAYAASTPDLAGGVGTGETKNLEATGFFTASDIPAGSTNLYIRVRIRRRRTTGSSGRTLKDQSVTLLVAGSPTGSDLADTGADWHTSYADKWYGSSSSDAWGAGVTQAQAIASNFGVRLRVDGNSDTDAGHTPPEARVTLIEIEATFTDPVGMRRRATAMVFM